MSNSGYTHKSNNDTIFIDDNNEEETLYLNHH